uniref:Pentatricopeptide repeat protein n=1 Tax=Salvia miltiorrhiza TaxID=226208 RepID=A0A678WDM2_SALMI|nr:pentatricopeptide repeat protein [Salvia miltiorrhiza]
MLRLTHPRLSCGVPLQLSHSASSNQPSPSSTSDLSRLLQGPVPRAHLLQIHARVFLLNAHQNHLIATRLIGRYPSNSALKVFHHLRNPNIFPFNAIIRVLAEEGFSSNAFLIYKQLKFRQISPNDLTFSFLFKACSRGGIGGDCVKLVHSDLLKYGFISDPLVCNGLLMVYAKAVKDLSSARKVFDEMPDRNLVSCWTSLISGYARIGFTGDALELFVIMLKENLCPESDTMVNVFSACSSLTAREAEKWVNVLTQFVKNTACNDSACDYVNTVLIYLYGKCRDVENSRKSFDKISDNGKKSVLCWNSILGAYVQNDCALEALDVFKSMMEEYNCRPNHVTMVSVLSACAEVGDLELGSWVHEYLRSGGQKGVLSSNVNLATALIDMYSKCGDLDGAREVFEQMSKKDVVSFNAMIIGLAVNGKGEEALTLHSKMQELHLHPDSGTLLGVLCACSHSGLLDEGREIFKGMISPRLEHYACYVDLLARSDLIDEALGVVASMPFEPNNFVWGALLAGCVLHNRLELVEALSTNLVKVDPKNSAGYVMLSNSFAADSQWRDVMKMRGVMREKGVAKQPGCSWIKIGGVVHEFVAGSALSQQFQSVHRVLESLLKEMRLLGS